MPGYFSIFEFQKTQVVDKFFAEREREREREKERQVSKSGADRNVSRT